jgi:lactate permease
MDFFFAILPILLLIVLLTKPRPLASHVALPLAALVLLVLKATWFGASAAGLGADVVLGLLEALTPITIIWGAVFLFKTMEHSGGMDVVRRWLNGVSDNPVAQLMIIGWAFAFLIEGASGFGTPAALAAPLLVAMGFPPARTAVLTLMMNSVPVSFGAVGTPTWFGFAPLGLSEADVLTVSFKTAVLHAIAAFVIPPVALSFLVSWKQILRSLVFIVLSVMSCSVPLVLLARINYEFPALVAGAIGLLLTVWLAHARVGLRRDDGTPDHETGNSPGVGELVKATFPLWGTVVILVVTRIHQLGIKELLNLEAPSFSLSLGFLGELSVSAAAVLHLNGAFGVGGGDGAWTYKTLYVPALIPFFVVSIAAFLLYRMDRTVVRRVVSESGQRMVRPVLALLGALVLVRLMMSGGGSALVQLIGAKSAAMVGPLWPWFAPYLGAVGSFFSGSATISNLTFGGIQASIADNLSLNQTTILSLQSLGGAMGNMVCINNIVAVCSILGLTNREGFILRRTTLPMVAYGILAAVCALVLFGFA